VLSLPIARVAKKPSKNEEANIPEPESLRIPAVARKNPQVGVSKRRKLNEFISDLHSLIHIIASHFPSTIAPRHTHLGIRYFVPYPHP
jgi:hypothetical protein